MNGIYKYFATVESVPILRLYMRSLCYTREDRESGIDAVTNIVVQYQIRNMRPLITVA